MNQQATITGTVKATVPFEGLVLIGLFTKPIPEGLPIYGTLVSSLGNFYITDVKPGVYYLMATSVSWEMQAMDFLLPQKTLRTRSKKPIIVELFSSVPHQEVLLYPLRLDDPPILISLSVLINHFLQKVHKQSN
jgi:AraC family transcriptional regulator